MVNFLSHDPETAFEASKPLLGKFQAVFGQLPGPHTVMSEIAKHFKAYLVLHNLFLHAEFGNDEKAVVWQTINVENECHQCVPAHTGIVQATKETDEISEVLHNKIPTPSKRLEALHVFTPRMMQPCGNVIDA